jgi:hypothetical protein
MMFGSKQEVVPPPSPASWARSASGLDLFKYKKGKPRNPLIWRDSKRHIRAVNRHDRSVKRQILLALLSFLCHTSVC